MTAAVKAGREVALAAVLDLCDWVVRQPVDEGWQDARDAVSELIEASCQATTEENRPKYGLSEFRGPFGSLVRALYSDTSRSYILRDTTLDDLRTHDYLDLGINSPRGKAIEAGFDLVRWVALHLTSGGDECCERELWQVVRRQLTVLRNNGVSPISDIRRK